MATATPEESHREYLARISHLETAIKELEFPDFANQGIDMLVNVYGSEDLLTTMGIGNLKFGGHRQEIGGFKENSLTKPLFNIEIKNASHLDYMRRSDALSEFIGFLDPAQKKWNEDVARFVTDLLLNSADQEKLRTFLQTSVPGRVIRPSGDSWIVEIDGYEERGPVNA